MRLPPYINIIVWSQNYDFPSSKFDCNGIINVIIDEINTPARKTGVLTGIKSEDRPIITFPKNVPVLNRLKISSA